MHPIIFVGDLPSATISKRVKGGQLRKLASSVYTTDVHLDPEEVVRRHWQTIAGSLYPDAVITDRSAPTGRPVEGRLYLVHPRRERLTFLPGLVVDARRGAGALDGDIALPGGLHLASRGRALAENSRPTRSRDGKPRRTLDSAELGEWIDRLCRVDGETGLVEYRRRAEGVAPAVGTSAAALASLSRMIGVALGSRSATVASRALAARQAGHPYDSDRIARFDRLIDALRASAPQSRPIDRSDTERYRFLPFYEAYFSNYIEGTEFALHEAEAVVFDGKTPFGRTADAHDLLGTFEVVSDNLEMARSFASAAEFCESLQRRHQAVMGGRPETRPGQFKLVANQAGASLFVLPELVTGTLTEGFSRFAELDTAWERAVYAMFLVAEVHPFDDGNGRMARIMMNGELAARGESRIIIPTVFRSDYLGALRRLTRDDDPTVLIKALRFAHDYTASIVYDGLDSAENQLRTTNAFESPEGGRRLRLPNGKPEDI